MTSGYSVAILLYGTTPRDAYKEDKYRELTEAFRAKGHSITTVNYHDGLASTLVDTLLKFDAVLVWVNPIEQGSDRTKLDRLLVEVAIKGRLVSTHPEVILKMGTKDVLYQTRDMRWSGDVRKYETLEEFENNFNHSLQRSGSRVLKQYRGNGGDGVFKVTAVTKDEVELLHAKSGSEPQRMKLEELYGEFAAFFEKDGMLIDQEWNNNLSNGMVRCYVCGSTVAGFGYQEVNALAGKPPSKRYYYTEACGLFSDLRAMMEKTWIQQLKNILNIPDHLMPVIWDADFFINSIDGPTEEKYQLCEINVSCVSPFPPSAIPYMIGEVEERILNSRSV